MEILEDEADLQISVVQHEIYQLIRILYNTLTVIIHFFFPNVIASI